MPHKGEYSPNELEKEIRLDSILLCVRAGQTLEQATKTPACYHWFLHKLTKAERAPIVRAMQEEQVRTEQTKTKGRKAI